MQGIMNKPKCREDCYDHMFELKNNNGTTKLQTRINFCPKFKRDPARPDKTIPEYNMDNRFYTHAFVIGTEKKSIQSNAQQEHMHFQSMIKNACQKNNQVSFPKPNSKTSICSVCKERYRNYYEHIKSQSHRAKIQAAVYNSEILRLAGFYQSKWEGAHAKADIIVEELYKQNQDQNNRKCQTSEGESSEMVDENQENSNEDDEENEENEENEDQDENDDNQDNQDNEQQQQEQNEDNQQQQENSAPAEPIPAPTPCQPCPTPQLSTKFFHPRNQLIIFLHKESTGKYKVIKNIEQYFKKSNNSNRDLNKIGAPIGGITGTTGGSALEDRMILRNRDQIRKSVKGIDSVRLEGKKYVPKIKKDISSSYRDSSLEAGTWQNQKNKDLPGCRMKTRNQRRGVPDDSEDQDPSNRIEKEKEEQSKSKPKPNKLVQQPPFPVSTPFPAQTQTQSQPQLPNLVQPSTTDFQRPPPVYPFYHPQQPHPYTLNDKPTMMPNQPNNSQGPNQGSGQGMQMPPYPMYMGHPAQMKPPGAGQPGTMNPGNFMSMINPQYFNPNMMPYGMTYPHTMRTPQTSNPDSSQKQKPKAPSGPSAPQSFPMYWNPYMMMRPESSNEQTGYPRPGMGLGTGQESGQVAGKPPMANMGMYMPYQMDPRMYMRYPQPGFPEKKDDASSSRKPEQ